jgi:hypothetical protein
LPPLDHSPNARAKQKFLFFSLLKHPIHNITIETLSIQHFPTLVLFFFFVFEEVHKNQNVGLV